MTELTLVRPEFGLPRTSCACGTCRAACRALPGYLVPADLERLAPPNGTGRLLWAVQHLRASPGAIVRDGQSRELYRVPTLVPRRGEDRACHWLDAADETCGVWADAPAGCAMFSACGDRPETPALARRGLSLVLADWAAGGPYCRLWQHLWAAGLRAGPPEFSRRLYGD